LPQDWQSYRIETPDLEGEALRFDASSLAPQIAAPHSPANADDAEAFRNIPLDIAYIGACTGAKYVDLKAAAKLLRGRSVAKGVTLKVAPASLLDQKQAKADGTMQILEEAGAQFLPTSCGICAGYGSDRLLEGQVCLSSTARNFRGRMGAANSKVYLASPYTVAASAITGEMTDPRHLMEV